MADMEKKKGKNGLLDMVIAGVSLALCLAPKTVFHTCGVKPDGSWMMCHWTGEAVLGAGVVLTCLSGIRFFASPPMKQGIDISMLLLTVLTALLPGHLLPLCKMATMPCHVLFQPAVIFLAVFLALALAADIALQRKKEKDS